MLKHLSKNGFFKLIAAALCALTLGGCAGMSSLERNAVAGHVADTGSTATALAMGAVELNPLGPIGAVVAKIYVHHSIKAMPPEQQPEAWRLYGAVGWGAFANNACVVLVIATGGGASAPCLLLLPIVGISVFNSTGQKDEGAAP